MSGSPNRSAMRPIHGEESCTMPSLGNYWNFWRSADHRPIHLVIRQWSSGRPMWFFPIHRSLGQLAILEHSPRRFGESPMWKSARRMKHTYNCSSSLTPWASWRSWNPRQRGLPSRQFGSQLTEWSISSISPFCIVRPPTLQAIIQAWCCLTGTSFKLLGPVGDLRTLAKEVWRVANLEVGWPNEAHLQLLFLA
uniref:Uncharacterized protein n=1 Tax=Solanum tuberosum TaxID=4113 RepID=M1DSE3_SOLTU